MNISAAFEREKNIKALSYTTTVCIALFLFFFFAQWQLPVIPQPVAEESIEVNLGNSDEGLGDVAPMIPGEQSSQAENNYTPPATSQPVAQQQHIEGDVNEADDAPVVNNNPKPVVHNKPVPANNTVVNKPKPNTTPVTNPTPTPPSPKAVYKGGNNNGPGGNNADSYNGIRNQGIAGGKGDQGNPNGNPNSDSYKGNASSGNSGVRIRSGLSGRKFTRLPSFEDDFNENAKVAVDIIVDKEGNVTSAIVNPRGTTTTNANIRAIATRKARQLKLNAGSEDDQTGTILFDFKLRG
jgi:outer membrane biosynthesis protein TonB